MERTTLVLWLVFLALLWLPGISSAADQYCATRYMPGQQTECFKTMAEAEGYVRAEPSPAIGNAMLVRKSERFLNAGMILIEYGVKDTTPTYIGDYYSSHVPTGKHRGCWDAAGSGANTRGCDNEELLQQDILARYPYAGDDWSGSFSGSYILSDPSGYGSWDAQGPYVIVGRNPFRPNGMRTFRATLAGNGAYEDMTVDRNDWFECPQLFLSKTSLTGTPPVWPNVCYNTARAEIVIYQPSQCSDCPKDGNPLVAATGNKEYNESDFSWEGLSFSHSYSSGNDLAELSAFGNNWTHSFAERLMIQDGSPIAWRRNDNYYEVLVGVDASNLASRTSTATAVFREPDEVATVRTRVGA